MSIIVNQLFKDNVVYYFKLFLDDDRVEVQNKNEECLMTFTSGTKIIVNDKVIGSLGILKDTIYFMFYQEDVEDTHLKHDTKINYLTLDAYFKAEAMAFSYYLDMVKN